MNISVSSSYTDILGMPSSSAYLDRPKMLGAAGIDYDVILPSSERLDMGASRVAVLPADVARARQILSQPIPESFGYSSEHETNFRPQNILIVGQKIHCSNLSNRPASGCARYVDISGSRQSQTELSSLYNFAGDG
jgi:hypothetical protein